MISTIQRWLTTKWRLVYNGDEVVQAYGGVFGSPAGQVVLQHLIDNIYCQVVETNDAITLATHNGRRSVVHEILTNIDLAQNRGKYNIAARIESVNGDVIHES